MHILEAVGAFIKSAIWSHVHRCMQINGAVIYFIVVNVGFFIIIKSGMRSFDEYKKKHAGSSKQSHPLRKIFNTFLIFIAIVWAALCYINAAFGLYYALANQC